MLVAERREIEKKIVTKLIEDAIAAGYTVGVHNGYRVVIKESTDRAAILEEMFSVDSEHLLFYNKDGKRIGSVFLVYGNDGWDVIADNSANDATEAIIAGATSLANSLSE